VYHSAFYQNIRIAHALQVMLIMICAKLQKATSKIAGTLRQKKTVTLFNFFWVSAWLAIWKTLLKATLFVS